MSGTYPTEEELERIRTWPASSDYRPLFDYIHDLWSYADWGWSEKQGRDEKWRNGRNHLRVYHISTAGWSGNEDIIHALHQNFCAWASCWFLQKTGGHYVFKVKYPMIEEDDEEE